jgi:CheY-like chemotaxis protein
MPVTSGPQVLEMIRSDASTADLPVMFLTGKGDKESIMKVLALKPVGYQLKTITKDQLRKNIADYFLSQKRV